MIRPNLPHDREVLVARYAKRVTARLSERAAELPPGIAERLRVAREQAVERARAAKTVTVAEAQLAGSAGSMGRSRQSMWTPLASLLPLIALVGGLVLIQRWHTNSQLSAAADIDASLLTDDLPPAAYSDPGFVEFLKSPRD